MVGSVSCVIKNHSDEATYAFGIVESFASEECGKDWKGSSCMLSAYCNLDVGVRVSPVMGKFGGLRCKAVSSVPLYPMNAQGLVHRIHEEGKERDRSVEAT